MGGVFQESLQLFVTYGYCVFEYNICANIPNVLDGEPDYANAPFSDFFVRACINRPEVLDWKPGYANSPFRRFFAKARCPPVLAPSKVAAVKVYG